MKFKEVELLNDILHCFLCLTLKTKYKCIDIVQWTFRAKSDISLSRADTGRMQNLQNTKDIEVLPVLLTDRWCLFSEGNCHLST